MSEPCRADLEHMECFKLDAAAFLSKKLHHQFEVLGIRDISGHHVEIMSIQEKLAKQLQQFIHGLQGRMLLSDIILIYSFPTFQIKIANGNFLWVAEATL